MDRAASSVVAVVLLVAITVIAATTVGLALATPPEGSPQMASFTLAVDGEANSVSITHRGGDPVNLEETTLHVTVDGQRLDTDPPVPFFAASGFVSGPEGPFNTASPNTWRPGETGQFQIAGTNEPAVTPGSTVTVRIITDGTEIAEVTATA